MKILLDPPKPDSPAFEVDHQMAVALAALHESFIRIRAGRLGDQTATIVLQRDEDVGVALAAPKSVGIRAAVTADTMRANSRF